jgi:hypothetical protein
MLDFGDRKIAKRVIERSDRRYQSDHASIFGTGDCISVFFSEAFPVATM